LLSAALENVLRNALEAGTTTLVIETSRSEGFFTASVTDTGAGMNPRQAERAFDEFFTSKKTGTGLGLAFVQRVARVHGGHAAIESVEGKGTTVRIALRG
jgi:two-component system, NtrC family, sensor histidine kinase HydH